MQAMEQRAPGTQLRLHCTSSGKPRRFWRPARLDNLKYHHTVDFITLTKE